MVFCYQNCSDREKRLKFEAKGREFEITRTILIPVQSRLISALHTYSNANKVYKFLPSQKLVLIFFSETATLQKNNFW